MSITIISYLIILGLILGSFINALVWRLRQQLDDDGNPKKKSNIKRSSSNIYSITRGRSMCPNCKHELAVKDLVPVFSWLSLKGKCRYCNKPISLQYPSIELLTATLFVLSYLFWPYALAGAEWIVFGGFLAALVCLIALALYDYKWYILPSRLIYIAAIIYMLSLIAYGYVSDDMQRFSWALIAGVVYFVIFFSIFTISAIAKKRGYSSKDWLGFGDVRLVFLLGLIVGDPFLVFVAMFLASIIGIITILPSVLSNKINLTSQIPFGPFLIAGAVITSWWGMQLLDWYSLNILGL